MSNVTATGAAATRALLTLTLMLLLYAVAFGLALAMLVFATLLLSGGLPFGEFLIHWRAGAIIGGVGGLLALYALWPRRTTLAPPGPTLERGRHPRFFAELDSLANALETPPPRDVYVTAGADACVVQHGDFLGFGGQRALVLGLPLLAGLSQAELRAVLAHELAHFAHGDTRNGARVYAMRASLERAVIQLQEVLAALAAPFAWLARVQIAIALPVARAQERAADARAAAVAGAGALASALRRLTGMEAACQLYLERDLAPILQLGHLPPLAEGFRRFLAQPAAMGALDQATAHELQHEATAGDATHPPLRERLAALAGGAPLPTSGPAIALLDDVPRLEVAVLDDAWHGGRARKLRPLGWEATGALLLASWRAELAPCRALAGITPATLPAAFDRLDAIGRDLDRKLRSDAARIRGARAVGMALAVAAVDAGCRLQHGPGQQPRVVHGDLVFDPFTVVTRLGDGSLTGAAWRDQAVALGIADVDLGAVTAG